MKGFCANEPFNGVLQEGIKISSTTTQLTRGLHGGNPEWIMTVCSRPALIMYGQEFNAATGGFDFLPSTKGNEIALLRIAQSCLNASRNYRNEATGFDVYEPADNGQDYGTYLAQKIQTPCIERRFIEAYYKQVQFFSLHGPIAAFDLAIYNELTNQVNKLINEVDRQMFIPSGVYRFRQGSTAQAALEAWELADPNKVRSLFSLELVTT